MRFPEMHKKGNRFGAAIVTPNAISRNRKLAESIWTYYSNSKWITRIRLFWKCNLQKVAFGVTIVSPNGFYKFAVSENRIWSYYSKPKWIIHVCGF